MVHLKHGNNEIKIVAFANSVDPIEAAHYEPPYWDLHCLPSICDIAWAIFL